MKQILAITTVFFSMLLVAQAEYRVIAIEIFKSEKKEVAVNIHSEVESENKRSITIIQASEIIEKARGWGSSVGVAVKIDQVSLSEYLSLLSKISENVWLDLEGLSSNTGTGYLHIMKHYKIEQGSGGNAG
ncbi:MAG: hypothetical protein AAF065_01765 [Verrucomicrobiota bacterium]